MTEGLQQSHWLKEQIVTSPTDFSQKKFEAAVIGGGYSGLSAAITLAESGVETVLFEQHYCGYGASGRNAGHLTPTIGKDIPSLLLLYGKEKTKELVQFAESAVTYTESFIRDNNVACDYVPSGNILAAVTPSQQKRLEKSALTAQKLNLDITVLNGDEMQSRGLPRAFISGVLENKGGTLHPGKYLLSLKQKAIEAGVTISENTSVIRYQQKAQFVIETIHRNYEVNKIIITTNAFPPLHSYLKKKTVPLSVSLIETDKLTDQQMDIIMWKGREGIYTAHEILESYRLSKDNTIVAGSKTVTYHPGYTKLGLPGKNDHLLIKETFYQRFSELKNLKIAHEWSGPISFCLDFLPIIKSLDINVTTACAYGGHGIAMATYGGHVAAQLLLKKTKENYLMKRKVISIPPQPFRYLLAKFLITFFRFLDRLTDKKVIVKQ